MTPRDGSRELSTATNLRVGALGVGALAAGVVAVAVAEAHPPLLVPPFAIPWLLLVPLYIAGAQLSVDLEFRDQSRLVMLTQLPLALGVVFVAPWLHLAARMIAAVVELALLRRQGVVKASFNVGLAGLEVGVAVLVHDLLLQSTAEPGLRLWLSVFAALLVSDVATYAVLGVLFAVLGLHIGSHERLMSLGNSAWTTTLFACVSVVSVSALWTDPLVAVVILVLAGGLALGYCEHRRLALRHRATAGLYDFVKELGPLDLDEAAAAEVVEKVRELLHAGTLDLAVVVPGTEEWRHLVARASSGQAGQEGPETRPDGLPAVAEQAATTGVPVLEHRQGRRSDTMATPVLGGRGLLGVLTVSDRLGEVRGFDLQDLRLLEAVASALGSALEGGRLLRDLGRAATTDPLTGLPNLVEVTRQVQDLLDEDPEVVLAALTVESFREVNDTLGHQVGDDLLSEVSRRLRSGSHVVVGRLGGGRFAVAVPSDQAPAGPEMFGLAVRAAVEGPAQLGSVSTHVRLVVGVVQAPDHGMDAEVLLRRAENAMAGARSNAGGPVLWEPAYEVRGHRRLAVVTALREAVVNGSVTVALQPQVDVRHGGVVGVEALARWTHPALGEIQPDEFVPLAQASGLMPELTRCVLRQALRLCLDWQGLAPGVGVAVNVSSDTVLDPSFITDVEALLDDAGAPAALLTLEITESVLVADADLAVERLGELRRLGVRLSVDDFGTGYSSLTYLKGLPIHEVKIDKGFVRGLASDRADVAVVRAVVDIAHALDLQVVAEGVEDAAQLEALTRLGVDAAQGYLHARPMPAAAFSSWLSAPGVVQTPAPRPAGS